MPDMASESRPLRVFLYLRTSTDQQDDSPEVQLAKIRPFLSNKGWEEVDVYYDIVTGKAGIEKRPRFRQMLEDAKLHGVEGFVALVWDRFLRSTRVKTHMEDRLLADGLFIWGIDDNLRMGRLPGHERQRAGEKAMVNMTTAMTQYYSDFVSDKIADHHEFRVGKGLHHSGAPPFAYKPAKDAYEIDGRRYDGWVPDDTPDGSADGLTIAERYSWIIDRFIACENLTDIACDLTAKGVPTPRLVQWSRLSESERARRLDIQARNKAAGHKTMDLPPSQVWDSSVLSDMLRSEAYLGRCCYTPSHLQEPGKKKLKVWYDGHHRPLNTPERHAQVMAILDGRGRDKRMPASRRTDALMAGMLICTCGHALTFDSADPTTDKKLRYRCNMAKKSRGAACAMSPVPARPVERAAYDLLMRGLKLRISELRAAMPLVNGASNSDLETELAALKAKRGRILENFEDGAYGDGPAAKIERDARLSPLLKRIELIEEELAPGKVEDADTYAEALTNIRNLWDGFPMAVKRDILRTYVPEGFRVREVPSEDGKDRPRRILRAEVCGNLLETDIEILDPPTPGQRPQRYSKPANPKGWPASVSMTEYRSRPEHEEGKIGAAGFEPTTSCTPSKRATKLRHAPELRVKRSIAKMLAAGQSAQGTGRPAGAR